ncbi:MAG: HD domain-containing protein [Dissulfuribacterales bacterium]
MTTNAKKIRTALNEREEQLLSSFAARSVQAIREHEDLQAEEDHRQAFALDADRILHSLSYTRYIDKTQVFSLIPNDHITHRVLHVQLVSKIARTIGRVLALNEDLIEAIALGHDLGHPPFGHDGERYLSKLCERHGIGLFSHTWQAVHALRFLEKKGKGCNLTLQTLDGILCHDGELHLEFITSQPGKNFGILEQEMQQKRHKKGVRLQPMTLEGCVVRMADVISYIGRDVEDAIRLGLICRDDLPKEVVGVLGNTNGKIVYRLVEDLITQSQDRDEIRFSSRISQALLTLKQFNYKHIYKNKKIKTQAHKIERLYAILFETFLNDIEADNQQSVIFTEFLYGMNEDYLRRSKPAEIVRDFMAGMTDDYFLRTSRELLIPSELPAKF